MSARTMERKLGAEQVVDHCGMRGLAAAICGSFLLCALPSQVSAQCGIDGYFSGECVDLRWLPEQQTVIVGEMVEIGLYAFSINEYGQPVHGIDVVANWNPAVLGVFNNADPCTAGDTVDPCFFCPADDPPGAPASYNWMRSCFQDDSNLDYLNEGCEGGVCCEPGVTGVPVNDGDVHYQAWREFWCNGIPIAAPEATLDGLLVTNFRFVALETGTVQVSMEDAAPCVSMEMWCRYGDSFGEPCTTDDDCGGRTCQGGIHGGESCTDHSDCAPNGVCDVICTACGPAACCTPGEDNCSICSFAETRVVGGSGYGEEVTRIIGPPAQITVTCDPPTVTAAGPRYLGVDVPAGDLSVALYVSGVDEVSCVSGYVQSNGKLGLDPVYKTPAGWATTNDDPEFKPRVFVRGENLMSGKTYEVKADCDSANPGTSFSNPASATLWINGDCSGDGDMGIFDVLLVLNGFRGAFRSTVEPCTMDEQCPQPWTVCDEAGWCAFTLQNVDLFGMPEVCTPNKEIEIIDLLIALNAFRGMPDMCPVSCP